MKRLILPIALAMSLPPALTGCNNESLSTSIANEGKGAQIEPGGYVYFLNRTFRKPSPRPLAMLWLSLLCTIRMGVNL